MRSSVPSSIRWKGTKGKEELLDDPVAESLFGLFRQVANSPRHIDIKPERLINEVYYIISLLYQDSQRDDCLERCAHEIKLDLGWKYAEELVMPMAYVVGRLQRRVPRRVENLLQAIADNYRHSCYWDACQQTLAELQRTRQRRTSQRHTSQQRAGQQQAPRQQTGLQGLYLNTQLSEVAARQGEDISKLLAHHPILLINNVEQLNAVLGENATIQK